MRKRVYKKNNKINGVDLIKIPNSSLKSNARVHILYN